MLVLLLLSLLCVAVWCVLRAARCLILLVVCCGVLFVVVVCCMLFVVSRCVLCGV